MRFRPAEAVEFRLNVAGQICNYGIGIRQLRQSPELLYVDPKLLKDFRVEWRTNLTAAMDRYRNSPAIGMRPSLMTAGMP